MIMKKIYDTLIEAAEKNRIGRQDAAILIGPDGIPGSSVDIDLVTPDSLHVMKVAEGAAIPIDVVAYTSFNMKPDKFGVRPLITKEMMEDGKWDLLAHNIKIAGAEIGENEDGLILTDALDIATNTVAETGENITIADITRAMQYVEDSDFRATTMYIGPEVLNDLRNIDTFVEVDKSGSPEALRNGTIGRLFGMDVKLISANIIDTRYAYVFDKNHAFVIAEKRPITVERYDDVTHDMSGAVITQRIKVRYLDADAICKITTA